MARQLTILAIALAALSSLLLFAGRSSLAQVTFTVNSTADFGDEVCDATECTLREAIDAANTSAGLDTIVFDPTVFPAAAPAIIAVHGELPDITDALTIDGSGAGVIIEPEAPLPEDKGLFGLLVRDTDESSPTNFTLIGNDFTIRGFIGGGIIICGREGPICSGPLGSVGPIEGVTITGSTIVAGNGAGIHIFGNNISGVSIQDNPSITGDAQGISIGISDVSTFSVSDVSISGNGEIAGGIHHGIVIWGIVNGVSISGNGSIGVPTGPGEGIYMPGDSITNVSIDHNASISAVDAGIGIGWPGGIVSNVSVTHNGFISGTSVGVGIGASDMQDIFVDDNGEIRGESEHGVAISSFGPGLIVSNISVSGNSSVIGGQTGIGVGGGDVSNVAINENDSVSGGVTIGGGTVDHIAVNDNGVISSDFGGIHVDGGLLSNVSIARNESITGGTGVHLGGDNVRDVSIADNDSIAGSDSGVGVTANIGNENISIHGNGPISGGLVGIVVQAESNADIVLHGNESIVGGDQGVSIGGASNVHVAIRSNSEITGEVGVYVSGMTNTGVSVKHNEAINGDGGGAVRVEGESNADIVVRGNESISDPGGEGVSVSGQANSGVTVVGNAITVGVATGISIEGEPSSRLLVAGNEISSGFLGIIVIGANPAGPRNLVVTNSVQASTPDAVFGIVLVAAERNLVVSNRVDGFAGKINIAPDPEPPILIGGGIGVIFGSSNNLIAGNIVDSDPGNDLFWDETGTGNRWRANICDTSQPEGLC